MDERFVIGFAVGAGVTAFMLFSCGMLYLVFRPWIRLKVLGGQGTMIQIIAMRMRGTPPMLIVDAYSALLHSGEQVKLAEVESQYVAHRGTISGAQDLIDRVRKAKPKALESPRIR